jgi:hypothetical protein
MGELLERRRFFRRVLSYCSGFGAVMAIPSLAGGFGSQATPPTPPDIDLQDPPCPGARVIGAENASLGLSGLMTFDNFIVGSSNRVAYEAAVAVLREHPGASTHSSSAVAPGSARRIS